MLYYINEIKKIFQYESRFENFNPKLAFAPISFGENHEIQRAVIFMEQKTSNNNNYHRIFRIYSIEVIHTKGKFNSLQIQPKNSSYLPKFLDEIPKNYYKNSILNNYFDECLHCNESVYLLLNVNGIPKYCQTFMDKLSDNVLNI
jgi:hypothetical protein